MAFTAKDTTEDTVEVKVTEYARLIERDNWLSCLEQAGVDNWDMFSPKEPKPKIPQDLLDHMRKAYLEYKLK